MSIDQNDNGTMDLLTAPPEQVARSELERQVNRLRVERDALESKLAPLHALADAIAALPVFLEMAGDLDDLRDRVDSLEQAAEEIPTTEDVIESVTESILCDRADLDELAKGVANRLSVDVEIECVDMSASASVSVA